MVYGVLQSPEFLQFFVRFAGLSLLAIKAGQAEMRLGRERAVLFNVKQVRPSSFRGC